MGVKEIGAGKKARKGAKEKEDLTVVLRFVLEFK